MMSPLISVCIPTYEMKGQGGHYLDLALTSLHAQTFRDFEVVIADHSVDDTVQATASKWFKQLPIRYFRNPHHRGNSSANVNFAINQAKGTWIKPLFQDDAFDDATALDQFAKATSQQSGWIACGCHHIRENNPNRYKIRIPKYHPNMLTGTNTIGAPSVVMFKKSTLRFDESLIWLMDCELYHHLYITCGYPTILKLPLVLIREWSGTISESVVTESINQQELAHLRKKYPDYFKLHQKVIRALIKF